MEWIYETLDRFWLAYAVIFILTGIVYKVAFARRLPVLKALIIYLFLAAGCYLFTIMHFLRFPVVLALAGTVVLIIIARLRMTATNRKREDAS
ncbi:YlaH-like family protein [Numidum massiliense]|uniref:YlaH-like family protein n=1 Tax=Numidum massiliense TaxID=1522315 RepID=UPI0006D54B11|nr:YlaH-like family protein [Numidum massiliense]